MPIDALVQTKTGKKKFKINFFSLMVIIFIVITCFQAEQYSMLGGILPQASAVGPPPRVGVEEKGLLIDTDDDEQKLAGGEMAAHQTRFTYVCQY